MSIRRSRCAWLALVVPVPALFTVAAGVATPAGASTAAGARVSCSACGHNLISNPGAEAGKGTQDDSVVPVPGWKGSGGFTAAAYAWSGGDISSTSVGPHQRGKNYFYGGPDSARSTGTQVVPLAPHSYPGRTTFTLSGWLGGYSSQDDNATLDASFLNRAGKVLGQASVGPVSAAQRKDVSGLFLRSMTGTLPSGTTEVVLKLVMVRSEGSDNDGMADNLGLVLKAAKPS